MENSKTCSKCRQIKPLDLFRKDSRLKSGYGSQCKSCKYEQTKAWVNQNLDRKYAINKKWADVNKSKKQAATKKWAIANKSYLADKNKKYRAVKKVELRAYAKNYRDSHKLEIAKSNKAWRIANSERKKRMDELWWRSNPKKVRTRNANRRARKLAASNFVVTEKDVKRIMAKPCAYCGNKSEHLDHVLPLFLGGSHSIGNLVGACRHCNLSKGKKLLSVWRYESLAILLIARNVAER